MHRHKRPHPQALPLWPPLLQQPLQQRLQRPPQLQAPPPVKAKRHAKARRKSTAKNTRPLLPTERTERCRSILIDSSDQGSPQSLEPSNTHSPSSHDAFWGFLLFIFHNWCALEHSPILNRARLSFAQARSPNPTTIPAKSVAPNQWLSRNAKKHPSRVLFRMSTK